MKLQDQFTTEESKYKSSIELWFHDSVAPDTRRVMEQMAQTMIKLEETLVELCLNNEVGFYIRGEKNAGLSLIHSQSRAIDLYKNVGQWQTSNESCNF